MKAMRLRRHEVDDGGFALRGCECGFQDQCVVAVSTRRPRAGFYRRDKPAAVLMVPEQCRKEGSRVETWPAQPIDRTGLRYKRRALAVADEPVVFNGSHERLPPGLRRWKWCLLLCVPIRLPVVRVER